MCNLFIGAWGRCCIGMDRFAVVDLFAGPGGLAEGFSSFRSGDIRPFEIHLSIEKEKSAHATLLLRSFLRQFESGFPDEYFQWLNGQTLEPDWRRCYPHEWADAEREALNLTLGESEAATIVDRRIRDIRAEFGDRTILVGGPPCQAYSLVGRARNRGNSGYVPEQDARHYLYREYIRILRRLEPAAFVMENVKGMLSSSVDGSPIFLRVLADLRASAGEDSYELFALAPGEPSSGLVASGRDFVIRAEDFGVPQARHRVIVVGLRRDIADRLPRSARPRLQRRDRRTTVSEVLDAMPPLRSGIGSGDSAHAWQEAIEDAVGTILRQEPPLSASQVRKFRGRLKVIGSSAAMAASRPRSAEETGQAGIRCAADLERWLRHPKLRTLPNNETRSHMASDLARYLYAAVFAEITGTSPKAGQFPEVLAPRHRNWTSGKFADRFRVQVRDQPSSTVTSHISKDGHYFIHPDPIQCRSLTVREAARLQTFPDDYLFRGNRTQQFVQVGNAVPPFLALQIADALWTALSACAAATPDCAPVLADVS